MLLPGLAESAAGLANAGAKTHSGVLEDWDGAKQNAGEEGNQEWEEQGAPINANFTDARKSCGSEGSKNTEGGISEAQADGASEQPEKDALKQEIRSDAATARAKSGAHGQLLTAAFYTHEQQIGDVGTRDQKDHADRTHQNPEDPADLPAAVPFAQPYTGPDTPAFDEPDTEPE